MRRLIVILGVVITAAAPAAITPVGRAAGGLSVMRFPVSFSLFNPCTNESIDFSGNAALVLDTSPTDGHIIFHSTDVHVTGTGETTGNLYVEHFDVAIVQQGNEQTGPYAETNPVHFSIITPGEGSGGNLEVESTFHFTINADDVVTTFQNTLSMTCV